jgi:hypothetical protein
MSRLAERYWASLTDSQPESLGRLIEHGRRKDGPLWRRYLASLLDVALTGQHLAGAASPEQSAVAEAPPASTLHYTLDPTIDVGTPGPPSRSRGAAVGYVLVAVLAFVTVLGVSVYLSGGRAVNPPGRQVTPSALPSPSVSLRQETGGFAWATPGGWRRAVQSAGEVHYTSPDGTQELAASSAVRKGNLLKTWRTSEANAHQGEDYRRIRLAETTFRGNPAVVWEYTFTLKGVQWHARLLGFTVDRMTYQINTWYQQKAAAEAVRIYNGTKAGFTVTAQPGTESPHSPLDIASSGVD